MLTLKKKKKGGFISQFGFKKNVIYVQANIVVYSRIISKVTVHSIIISRDF